MKRLADLAIDWGRIEVWCEQSSGKAICGPVLDRVRSAGEELEAERDSLVEALERIAHDGPNPGSLRSPELQWASDIARAALAKVRDA